MKKERGREIGGGGGEGLLPRQRRWEAGKDTVSGGGTVPCAHPHQCPPRGHPVHPIVGCARGRGWGRRGGGGAGGSVGGGVWRKRPPPPPAPRERANAPGTSLVPTPPSTNQGGRVCPSAHPPPPRPPRGAALGMRHPDPRGAAVVGRTAPPRPSHPRVCGGQRGGWWKKIGEREGAGGVSGPAAGGGSPALGGTGGRRGGSCRCRIREGGGRPVGGRG